MIKVLPRNMLRFVLLVFFQVLVLNNIQLGGYINPYLYILFILLLPFETPPWMLLLTGFLLGLTIDLFVHTPGVHTIATLFMAFSRPYVLDLFAPREGYETGTFPRLYYYGLEWFLKYTLILVFAHHLVLFYVEVFRFSDFFSTFLRVILSTFFSTILVVISQYFVFRK
ncbi:MAG: rod shape-determining protein MreD [Bacteroidales bacterium]